MLCRKVLAWLEWGASALPPAENNRRRPIHPAATERSDSAENMSLRGRSGTPPNCYCPSGTTGPGCKNVIVR